MIKKLQSKSFQRRLVVIVILFLMFIMSYGITTTIQSWHHESNYSITQFASISGHHVLGLVVGKNHNANPNKKNWDIARRETRQASSSNASQVRVKHVNTPVTHQSPKRLMMIARYINANDVNRHGLQSASLNKKTGRININFKNRPNVAQKRYANYLLQKLNA